MGGFRRIYPQYGDGEDPYTKFFDQSTSLCAETAASRARAELARVQVHATTQTAGVPACMALSSVLCVTASGD